MLRHLEEQEVAISRLEHPRGSYTGHLAVMAQSMPAECIGGKGGHGDRGISGLCG